MHSGRELCRIVQDLRENILEVMIGGGTLEMWFD